MKIKIAVRYYFTVMRMAIAKQRNRKQYYCWQAMWRNWNLVRSWEPLWKTARYSKESACQCRKHKKLGFNPRVRKIPWRRKGTSLQYSCLENSQEAFEFLFNFCHKGGVICISEVTDISPRNLDSSLCFFQPSVSHDVLCM